MRVELNLPLEELELLRHRGSPKINRYPKADNLVVRTSARTYNFLELYVLALKWSCSAEPPVKSPPDPAGVVFGRCDDSVTGVRVRAREDLALVARQHLMTNHET
ncbi:jg11004 [Pararge aegeria aegeria]|uniref:Jg11004 protein n=1 Tax=Pararge aegeria aegeria TaxID=348720 RepID=A0A8S4S8S1_9NEOP|nr:jg11004 [Pararge aegeria aegeria]